VARADDYWIDAEVDPGVFRDVRLARRLRLLLGQLARAPGQSLALVCQDWANTKAAYRFLSNERVDEAQILAGHFAATRRRMALARDGPVLILHDTTEFSWTRKSHQAIGMLGITSSGHDTEGRSRIHTVCGLLMHSSLAVTCQVQGHQCPEAVDQSNARSHRTEGEHLLARQPVGQHCMGQPFAGICAYR
jgi:hypothetical protein